MAYKIKFLHLRKILNHKTAIVYHWLSHKKLLVITEISLLLKKNVLQEKFYCILPSFYN